MSTAPATQQGSLRLNVGSTVDGRYEIVGFLGQGGFARVYKAKHVHMGRMVALKVLNLEADEDRARQFEQRFLNEAKLAASIRHPNIVTIHDFGFTGALRQPYIAMELIPGHDLETELQNEGGMAPSRVVPLFIDVLEALGVGHNLGGIVHKDLKPANLFLTAPGTAEESLIVLDFGVARAEKVPGGKLTVTGTFNGTPQYLSPEYIQDQLVTPSLDVYQMGLILVEMLTGRPVVGMDNPYECIVAHCSGALELPETLMQTSLGAVIATALSLEHTERYKDATAFATALRTVDAASVATLAVPSTGGNVHSKATAAGPVAEPQPASGAAVTAGPVPESLRQTLEPASEAVIEKLGDVASGDGFQKLKSLVQTKPLLLAIPAALVVLLSVGILGMLVSASGTDGGGGASEEQIEALPVLDLKFDNGKLESLAAQVEEAPNDEALRDQYDEQLDLKDYFDSAKEGTRLVESEDFQGGLKAFDSIPEDSDIGVKVRGSEVYARARDGAIGGLLKRIQGQMVLKQWSEARASVEQVLAIDPDNADAKDYRREIGSKKSKGGGGRFGFRP